MGFLTMTMCSNRMYLMSSGRSLKNRKAVGAATCDILFDEDFLALVVVVIAMSRVVVECQLRVVVRRNGCRKIMLQLSMLRLRLTTTSESGRGNGWR